MIYALVNQTSPVGTVEVSQFREAADAATALAAFVSLPNPPLNPADWLAFDTGWASYQNPNTNYHWVYDFGVPGLVQVLDPDRLVGHALTQVVEGPKADPSGGSSPFAWEMMGALSVQLDLYMDSADKAQLRIWGQHKTHQEGGNVPQVRLAAGGVAYSDEVELPDTGGDWQNFSVISSGYTVPVNRTLFQVQTKLRNASSTIELRAVSIAVMEKR